MLLIINLSLRIYLRIEKPILNRWRWICLIKIRIGGLGTGSNNLFVFEVFYFLKYASQLLLPFFFLHEILTHWKLSLFIYKIWSARPPTHITINSVPSPLIIALNVLQPVQSTHFRRLFLNTCLLLTRTGGLVLTVPIWRLLALSLSTLKVTLASVMSRILLEFKFQISKVTFSELPFSNLFSSNCLFPFTYYIEYFSFNYC